MLICSTFLCFSPKLESSIFNQFVNQNCIFTEIWASDSDGVLFLESAFKFPSISLSLALVSKTSVPKHVGNWDMSLRKNRISRGYFGATQ